ncbi:pilus assembly protein TadG-related protein [Nocardioides zeae]|uniref:Pilus assembly protein TadG-related protein n=1 Tax=Nocardioides imazamoxiresistens TaxID=3231893 RepID=A0ABU3Q194_9ACTN|nr:pilus assembly protein TadG-related protein [Nocardioides zeae]MDT9595280.1 pilus assembly protein TadG-related protein [Nocardioides zeae]
MAPARRRARDGGRDQRGAVAVLVAVLLAVLLGATAFVVDLGMQRVLRQDLQALADVVALDLVRDLDGRDAPALRGRLDAEVTAALERNAALLGDEAPVVTYELGELTTAGAFRRNDAAPSAVLVHARSSVRYAFTPGRGAAARSAVANATSSACYQLGSYAAMVQTGRSALLNPLLRRIGQSNATLSALDYTGLVGTQVSLDRLAAELGVGTVNELATTSVRAGAFALALARALPAGANPTHVNVANALEVWARHRIEQVNVGRILGISSGSPAVVGANLNLLDLVAGSLFAINGTNFIDSYVGTLLPGIINTGVRVKLVQGPRQFCGRPGSTGSTAGSADTEQLSATVNATLNPNVATVSVPAIPGLLGSASPLTVHQPNNVNVTVSAAATESVLQSVTCGSTRGVSLDVTNGLATVTLETNVRTTLVADLALGALGSLTRVQVDVNAGVRVTATLSRHRVSDVRITVPPQAYDTFYPTGTSGVSLGAATRTYANASAHLSLLGGLLGAGVSLTTAQQASLIDSAVTGAVRAYFDASNPNSIVSTLVNPILALTGTDVAGSRVALSSSPGPQCGTPALRG